MKGTLDAFLGDDNFVRLDGLGVAGLFLKVESFNPAGSIKFKTALGLIRDLEAAGRIGPDTILIESSSGNLGVSLAMLCAGRGYRFVCVVDPNASRQNVACMRALGARVVCVEDTDENGGYLGTRLAYIRQAVARDGRYLWLNQYENPANPAMHAATTAQAIDRAFPRLDWLFVGVGTSGTLTGCARHFRARPDVRLVAVDSLGSVTFGLPAGRRYLPGVGSSQPPKLFDGQGLHALVAVPEAATIATCRHLARRFGFLAGGSTGTVLAAVRAARQRFVPGDVVVAVAPDGGERYLDTIYDDDWVSARFGTEILSGEPDVAPPARILERGAETPAAALHA